MKIESRREGSAAVVTVSGRMDAASALEELPAAGVTHGIVGMADLQDVSSMGLRSFLVIARQAKAEGGGVPLCGLHETTDAALQSV